MGIRRSALVPALAVGLWLAPSASAEEGEDAEGAESATPGPSAPFLVLDTEPRWAGDLEGYAGIGVQATSGDDRAHGFVGGLLRIRYGLAQVGGTYETTDSGEATALSEPEQEHWRAVGAFAGVWLPYRRWVDLEATLGLSSRSYVNSSRIYGPDGFDLATTAVTFRFGVSDRMTERQFGPRVGAALVGGIDLDRHSPGWRREYLLPDGTLGATTGVTEIGGVSIGLVVTVGLEVGGGVYRHR